MPDTSLWIEKNFATACGVLVLMWAVVKERAHPMGHAGVSAIPAGQGHCSWMPSYTQHGSLHWVSTEQWPQFQQVSQPLNESSPPNLNIVDALRVQQTQILPWSPMMKIKVNQLTPTDIKAHFFLTQYYYTAHWGTLHNISPNLWLNKYPNGLGERYDTPACILYESGRQLTEC